MGGLGFKSFERFNEAMLAKLAWWVLSNRDSFCVKVLRAKNKVTNHWLQATASRNASFTWKGLEGVRPLLTQGACLLLGSGEQILVWDEPWILELPHFKPQPNISIGNPQVLVVESLMLADKCGWDLSKLRQLFDDATIQAILNIPLWL